MMVCGKYETCYMGSSRAAIQSLAENYAGLPDQGQAPAPHPFASPANRSFTGQD
jgi:hypothetical protein